MASFKDVIFVEMFFFYTRKKRVDMFLDINSSDYTTTLFRLDTFEWIATSNVDTAKKKKKKKIVRS